MPKYLKIFIAFYLPVLAWMGVIFYFSSISDLRYTREVTPEIILRKGAHFLEYIILAVLFWRVFYHAHSFSLGYSLGFSLFFTSLYAVSDEYHQLLVPGRSGRVTDVIYDVISAFIGLQIIAIFKGGKIKKTLALIFFSALVLAGMEYRMIEEGKQFENKKNGIPFVLEEGAIEEKMPEEKEISDETAEDEETKKEEDPPKAIPEKKMIKVPFTSQAPLSEWDDLHEEACEEASLIMVKYYLDKKALNKDIAEKEIQDIVKFEIKKYGDYKDSNAEEIVQLAKDYYDITNLQVVYDFKSEDMKKYLARGKPIIVPAAGRKLGNPNFTPPGPLYHNLVLVGYDSDTIVTNDPGTRKGEGYEYDVDFLYGAIHDFTGKKEDIEKGRKAMIIVE